MVARSTPISVKPLRKPPDVDDQKQMRELVATLQRQVKGVNRTAEQIAELLAQQTSSVQRTS